MPIGRILRRHTRPQVSGLSVLDRRFSLWTGRAGKITPRFALNLELAGMRAARETGKPLSVNQSRRFAETPREFETPSGSVPIPTPCFASGPTLTVANREVGV